MQQPGSKAFSEQEPGWRNLPNVLLCAIARILSLGDRKACTLVCHRWNNVVFSDSLNGYVTFPLAKWEEDKYVLFSGFHPRIQRSYRNVRIPWIKLPNQYLLSINKMIETLPKYALQKLIVIATPDETLAEFFEQHRPTLNHIRKLEVFIESPFNQYPLPANEGPLDIRQCSINMPALQWLEWTEASLGNISHGRQYFLINAPLLSYARVQTLRNWNCYTVLNIKNCSKLKNAILELPSRIWRTFHKNTFEHLETLNLTTESRAYAIENIAPMQFDQLFATMKKLQAIKMTGAKDSALQAVCQSCPLIWSIDLSQFEVDFESFAKLAGMKKLRNLSLTNGKITGSKGKILCESLQTLRLHNVELAGEEYKGFPIQLNDIMKSKLRYSKRENVIICSYSTR